jgi:DNA-binding winged helix-turn-helix (wHTH) protein
MNSTSAATGMQFSASSAIPAVASLSRYIRFGPFHLDVQEQELFKDGSRVRVQGKVCEALMILVENPGEVVTRETLRARLWPADTQINYDANVNTTVNKLRQVLGDSPDRPTFVETIPRKGYTFIASVESVEQSAFTETVKTDIAAPKSSEQKLVQATRQIFGFGGAHGWFTAGVVSLLIAAMLFGAAVVLYAHRGI